ncbi:protein asteroid homolog 1 [Spea bombifrons]|uniref:protein asteroid homolog 1 n=1 Tax=Spea bombifrons TaxID=233779 RepID=UPI00234BA688|nr:protein asteroid homolog 1 [Spea bombifrons]
MGIQGLMSYVGSNHCFLNDLRLRNTKIIIDGNNLYHKLYLDSGLEQVHGGSYDTFAELVHKFFESLTLCNIHAYVVLDGGCDISDKKLATQKQRARDKIKMAQSLSIGEGGSLLPLMVRDVFLQVLKKLQIPFVQCFAEADQEIVELANVWNCPILTFDSDFCIFDIKAGYCPLSYFQWKNIVTSKDNKECYVPARCFSARQFCSYFNNMNISLLPFFAVLTGNDYINLPALETFFSRVTLPIGSSFHGGRKHMRIHGLLNWLSTFATVEEAMENVVKYLRAQDRHSVRELLCSAMEEYNLSGVSNLEYFFRDSSYISLTAVQLNLPDWVRSALARGQIAPLLSDALVLKRTFLHVQVEDVKRPSAHLISQPIRQVLYGLLLNMYHDSQHKNQTDRTNKMFVVEFDRLETSLRKNNVEAIISSSNFSEDLSLQSLPELSLGTRVKLLLDTLGVRLNFLESVPPAHRLTVAVTCFWVRNANPKVRLHHLRALVMGIICGEAGKMLNTPELVEEGIGLVYEQVRKLKQEHVYGRKPNKDDLHIFCQWQCCFQSGLYFNQLLNSPLQEPDVTRIYNGPLVHQLTQKLKSSSSTEDLFKPSLILETLYQDFIQAVISSLPPDCFQSRTKSASSKSKNAKRQAQNTKQNSTTRGQSMHDACNRFASLFLEEEP